VYGTIPPSSSLTRGDRIAEDSCDESTDETDPGARSGGRVASTVQGSLSTVPRPQPGDSPTFAWIQDPTGEGSGASPGPHGDGAGVRAGLAARGAQARRRLDRPLGRAFLYARYNAELTRPGLAAPGLPDIDPDVVSALDSTAHIEDLVSIGERVAAQVELEHFGSLLTS
jgi:hypothetical protein